LNDWSSGPDLKTLEDQFIDASTVIKFIDSHRHWPPDRLDIIFGISPCSKTPSFAEMLAMYSHILFAASDNVIKSSISSLFCYSNGVLLGVTAGGDWGHRKTGADYQLLHLTGQ
jgi:hypothetical protein